jgi:hypothetical protein
MRILALHFGCSGLFAACMQAQFLPVNQDVYARHPLRVIEIDGQPQLYDLSLAISAFICSDVGKGVIRTTVSPGLPHVKRETLDAWTGFSTRVRGKVISVADDGLLVARDIAGLRHYAGGEEIDGPPMFLRHYAGQQKVVDGSEIDCFAIPVGRHTYITAVGAVATVPCMDCGRIYDPGEDKGRFSSMSRVTSTGMIKVALTTSAITNSVSLPTTNRAVH